MHPGSTTGHEHLDAACRDLLSEIDGMPVAAHARDAILDLLDHLQ